MTLINLLYNIDGIWAYCTEKWLKFQDNPGKHHNQRKNLYWWESVQKAYYRKKAEPLIRCIAINTEEEQLFNQAYGMITSFKALLLEKSNSNKNKITSLPEALNDFFKLAKGKGVSNFDFNDDVKNKRVKYHRRKEKLEMTNKIRQKYDMPILT